MKLVKLLPAFVRRAIVVALAAELDRLDDATIAALKAHILDAARRALAV